MKKIKLLTSLLTSIVGVFTSSSLLIANNNHTQSLNSNKVFTLTKTLDATLIGAQKGTFTIEYTKADDCTITKVSNSFAIYGDFNFNGGKFTFEGVTYTITHIGAEAFDSCTYRHFFNCNLTIPSTIVEIGKRAFRKWIQVGDDNNEIKSINFEEGLLYIDDEAFEYYSNIKQIKLPDSTWSIGRYAFRFKNLETIDLTATNHVINLIDDINIVFCSNKLKKIYVKSEEMKWKYQQNKQWASVAPLFEVKGRDVPTPKTPLTIGAVELGGKDGAVTLDIADPNNCIIYYTNKDFYVNGDFNFNGGKFARDGKTYTITKIADGAFKLFNQDHYLFENCNLTIPSTITEIGEEAFANCSRLDKHQTFKSINFENGIKDIGKHAFANTFDKNSNHSLVLPSSINHIGNKAFENNYLNEITLNAKEVIKTDCEVSSKDGCFTNNDINKIYVNSEQIKDKYSKDSWWSSYANIIEIK